MTIKNTEKIFRPGRTGFTLIELLIVVAIIGILATIAMTNFLSAQIRAKAARIKSDLRTLATGLEMYAVDNNVYPPRAPADITANKSRGGIHTTIYLTTPIDYLNSVDIRDPFSMGREIDQYGHIVGGEANRFYSYGYVNIKMYRREQGLSRIGNPGWALVSLGPDYVKGPDLDGSPFMYGSYGQDPIGTNRYLAWNYDPTNGAVSGGDILYWP